MSARGRIAGERGKRHERNMAAEITKRLPYGKAITSRDGRGGAQGGNDLLHLFDNGHALDHIFGWSIECKLASGPFATQTTIDKWMGQAKGDARGNQYAVVLYKQHGRRDVWAIIGQGEGWFIEPLEDWLPEMEG